MADLLPNIPIPADTMIDLYAESGIAVGTKVRIVNVGADVVNLFVKATQPDFNTDGYIPLPPAKVMGETAIAIENYTGDSGLWAYSQLTNGLVNVQVVS